METLNDKRKRILNGKRKMYPWLGEPDEIDEETLKGLNDCILTLFNSTCFVEGTCMDPINDVCPLKILKSTAE